MEKKNRWRICKYLSDEDQYQQEDDWNVGGMTTEYWWGDSQNIGGMKREYGQVNAQSICAFFAIIFATLQIRGTVPRHF
jgi:hypothetical protein